MTSAPLGVRIALKCALPFSLALIVGGFWIDRRDMKEAIALQAEVAKAYAVQFGFYSSFDVLTEDAQRLQLSSEELASLLPNLKGIEFRTDEDRLLFQWAEDPTKSPFVAGEDSTFVAGEGGVDYEGENIGRVLLAFDSQPALDQVQRRRYALILGATLLFAATAGLCLLEGMQVSRSVKTLVHTTERIAEGDFDAYAHQGEDELGRLGIAFNRMSKRVRSSLQAHERTEQDLRVAIQAAEAASVSKSAFLANMSHELRTPLHGILSYARFGRKKRKAANPEKLTEYFQKIETSGETLLHLVNDLLDLAKLEAGRMEFNFETNDLCRLTSTVVDEFRLRAAEDHKTILLETSEPEIELELDAVRVSQVVRNLIGNAVKFSPDGSVIEVEVRKRASKVVIGVLDRGAGVPESEIDLIFDEFVQSSKTKTNAGGTGLGLAICREIIDGHNGRISVKNRPEGGASFSVELPLNCAKTQSEKVAA